MISLVTHPLSCNIQLGDIGVSLSIHPGGPLHLGDIEDMGATESPRVVCPWHKWCFELATGKQVRPDWRHEDIQSFPVRTDPASGGVAIGFRSMNPNCFGAIDDF